MDGSKVARERWKILASVVTKKTALDPETQNKVSVRRFGGFRLFRIEDLADNDDNSASFQLYYCPLCGFTSPRLWIRKKNKKLNVKDLIGFNNTGNVCIWPSEEVLAYYLLKHKSEFEGKRICELGAGMTALAGVMLAAGCDVTEVLLTDGNQESVSNIESIINKNKEAFGRTTVHSRTLIWDNTTDVQDFRAKYDVIIAADCFFHVESHKSLLNVVDQLLTEKGHAIMMAPHRGHTLQQFVEAASSQFLVEIITDYDKHITEQHGKAKALNNGKYDEDIHYPVLVLLRRPAVVKVSRYK